MHVGGGRTPLRGGSARRAAGSMSGCRTTLPDPTSGPTTRTQLFPEESCDLSDCRTVGCNSMHRGVNFIFGPLMIPNNISPPYGHRKQSGTSDSPTLATNPAFRCRARRRAHVGPRHGQGYGVRSTGSGYGASAAPPLCKGGGARPRPPAISRNPQKTACRIVGPGSDTRQARCAPGGAPPCPPGSPSSGAPASRAPGPRPGLLGHPRGSAGRQGGALHARPSFRLQLVQPASPACRLTGPATALEVVNR